VAVPYARNAFAQNLCTSARILTTDGRAQGFAGTGMCHNGKPGDDESCDSSLPPKASMAYDFATASGTILDRR
jgi:hypothetical protein